MQFSFIRNIYFPDSFRGAREKPSIFRKHFPSLGSSSPFVDVSFSKKDFLSKDCCSTLVRRKQKSGFSNKKRHLMFSYSSRKYLAFAEEKREGVYIKHLYSFLLVWYIFASFSFALISQAMITFTGTFFHVVAAFSSPSLQLRRSGFCINLSYQFFSRHKRKKRSIEWISFLAFFNLFFCCFKYDSLLCFDNVCVVASIKNSMECQCL